MPTGSPVTSITMNPTSPGSISPIRASTNLSAKNSAIGLLRSSSRRSWRTDKGIGVRR